MVKNIDSGHEIERVGGVGTLLGDAEGEMCPLLKPVLLSQTLCHGDIVRRNVESEHFITDLSPEERVDSRSTSEVQYLLIA